VHSIPSTNFNLSADKVRGQADEARREGALVVGREYSLLTLCVVLVSRGMLWVLFSQYFSFIYLFFGFQGKESKCCVLSVFPSSSGILCDLLRFTRAFTWAGGGITHWLIVKDFHKSSLEIRRSSVVERNDVPHILRCRDWDQTVRCKTRNPSVKHLNVIAVWLNPQCLPSGCQTPTLNCTDLMSCITVMAT